MEIGPRFQPRFQRLILVAPGDEQFGDRQFAVGAAAQAERLDLRQRDRQVVVVEGEDTRHREFRRFMDQHALRQAQDDRVRIVGCEELPARGGRRYALAVLVLAANEDAAQRLAVVIAFLDAQGHAVAQFGELADLDRRAERARAKVELQPFIGVAGIGLDEADDREIERRERDRIGIGNAQQPPEPHADAAQHVELARRRKPPESKENPQHQPDRDAEREIFGDQVGEHPPHDADRAALGRDEIEQAQHLFEHEQHRRKDEGAEHREKDQPRDITVDGG